MRTCGKSGWCKAAASNLARMSAILFMKNLLNLSERSWSQEWEGRIDCLPWWSIELTTLYTSLWLEQSVSSSSKCLDFASVIRVNTVRRWAVKFSLSTVSLVLRHFFSNCRRSLLASAILSENQGLEERSTAAHFFNGASLFKIFVNDDSYWPQSPSRSVDGWRTKSEDFKASSKASWLIDLSFR